MEFNQVEFRVQMHNMPFLCMTKDICLYLGEQIRTVKEIDLGASEDCLGKYVQLHILIDITKPLKRVLRVSLEGSEAVSTLLLRYERLPDFCFGCGLIGHGICECPEIEKLQRLLQGIDLGYGFVLPVPLSNNYLNVKGLM
ncbi:hypothetical protein ACOSP7_004850 [Xanthoceras sorbifolium]